MSLLSQSEFFRPQPGQVVHCRISGEVLGEVESCIDNICNFIKTNGEANSYIWRFTKSVPPFGKNDTILDELNRLHYSWIV